MLLLLQEEEKDRAPEVTGPGGFGHTGPGGHTALDIPFRFQGECALCCPAACHGGCWCATRLVLSLLMAPHYLYQTLTTRTAEEEKWRRPSLFRCSVSLERSTLPLCQTCCALLLAWWTDRRQGFLSFVFFFYGGVCSGPTVARAVVQWQC